MLTTEMMQFVAENVNRRVQFVAVDGLGLSHALGGRLVGYCGGRAIVAVGGLGPYAAEFGFDNKLCCDCHVIGARDPADVFAFLRELPEIVGAPPRPAAPPDWRHKCPRCGGAAVDLTVAAPRWECVNGCWS